MCSRQRGKRDVSPDTLARSGKLTDPDSDPSGEGGVGEGRAALGPTTPPTRAKLPRPPGGFLLPNNHAYDRV